MSRTAPSGPHTLTRGTLCVPVDPDSHQLGLFEAALQSNHTALFESYESLAVSVSQPSLFWQRFFLYTLASREHFLQRILAASLAAVGALPSLGAR